MADPDGDLEAARHASHDAETESVSFATIMPYAWQQR
jgi:hypothetical protein